MDSFKRKLFGEPEPEPSLLGSLDESLSLSYKNRVYGFIACLSLGLVFCIISLFFIIPSLTKFAVFYTLGNIMMLGSICFLVGPMRQLKNMFQPTRIIASLMYVGSMALTLYAAFGLKAAILVFFCLIIQLGAIIWYVLSYIPYARSCIKNLISGVTSSI